MGNALCCSERNDQSQSHKETNFSLDDAKRKKILAANGHYNVHTLQDEDGRLSTLNPTPTLNSQPPTPNGLENSNKFENKESNDNRVSEFKLDTLSTEQTEQSIQCKQTNGARYESEKKSELVSANRPEQQLRIDFSNLRNDDTPKHHHFEISAHTKLCRAKTNDPDYVENSPNAILSYFQDNRRFLIDRVQGDIFDFNKREYVLLGSYNRDGYDVNQYYSLQNNSVIIEKKFREIKDLHNEVNSSKSFKFCKNLKVFISNMLSINEDELTIFYEMGNLRLKDLMRKNLLTEVQVIKIVLNLVQFILLSQSNQVSLKEIQQDQISLSLSSSQSASGASLNRYFVQLNNFLEPEDRLKHSWQIQVQHVSDIFSEYSEQQHFSQSCKLLTFIESISEETNMLEFLSHLKENYDDQMRDTLIDLSEEQVISLSNLYLTEQSLENNFEFYSHLFLNGSDHLNTHQQSVIVNKLNDYIYTNFKNKSKHDYVERCIKLFEEQCAYENLHELEVIYRIYHALLCFLNLNSALTIKQLIRALKLCKNPNVILLYQSLIYSFLSLSYIQKYDLTQAKNLFVYSNRIYQAHHKNKAQFPRNNFYQILIFAQALITYKLGYFETSLKRLEYLEKVGNKSKLLIEEKYILFMKGMNKMELDKYSEAEEHFEKTLHLVSNEETRQLSMTDFSKANSDATIDKNIFDILIMNILANSFNKNNDKLEQNIDTYQNYNSDYANDNKSVFQILNKILTVIL